MSSKRAQEIADEAWRKVVGSHGVAKKVCRVCQEEWLKGGSDPENPPAHFPPGFEWPCPDCGGQLSVPTFSF